MIRIRGLAPAVLLTVCSVGRAGDAAERATAPVERARVIERFGIPKAPGPIVVPVRLKGKVFRFLLDTGASVNVFDSSFRASLGDPVDAAKFRTGGAALKLRLYRAPEAHLGALSISRDVPVACHDLTMLRTVTGSDVVGILGMSFLRSHVIRVDFDNGKLVVLEPAAGEHPEWGEAVELSYDADGLPTVTARLGGVGIDLLVDTGTNMSGTLEGRSYAKMVRKNNARTTTTKVETATGTVKMSQARAPVLSLGPFTYEGLIFGKGAPSSLGLAFLARHVVTFDFPTGGETSVHAVDARSPAGEAGVRAKDVILRIGGDDAGRLELWEIGELLRSGHGKEIRMTIRRGEKVFDVSFRLKRTL
jgi:predicted aspartyl protease